MRKGLEQQLDKDKQHTGKNTKKGVIQGNV